MRLWVLSVDIYEASVGTEYPVVRHEFWGQTPDEAEGYLEAHCETDSFLRSCLEEGGFDGIDCFAESYLSPVETETEASRPASGRVMFDYRQLKIGTEVELEHTADRDVAREIAMDHLVEDPEYYDKLRAAGL